MCSTAVRLHVPPRPQVSGLSEDASEELLRFHFSAIVYPVLDVRIARDRFTGESGHGSRVRAGAGLASCVRGSASWGRAGVGGVNLKVVARVPNRAGRQVGELGGKAGLQGHAADGLCIPVSRPL